MEDDILFEEFKEDFENATQQNRPVVIQMDFTTAWALLGVLQLAFRHPCYNGPSSEVTKGIARALEESVALTPALKAVAQKGWQTNNTDKN